MCGLRTFHYKRQGWVQAFSHILGTIYLCSPAASCQLQSQLTATGRAARGAWGVWEQGSLCHAPARGRDAAAADLSPVPQQERFPTMLLTAGELLATPATVN